MPPITSEAIAEIAYDPPSRSLFVRFTSGEWYGYLDVPAALHADFVAAESKGRFFQQHIRPTFAHAGPLPAP